MKFRLKSGCGNHTESYDDGTILRFKGGEVIDTDNDLVAMFGDKFERVPDSEEASPGLRAPNPEMVLARAEELYDEEVEARPPKKKAAPKKAAPVAEDVSEDFELDEGMKVLKTGKSYSVFDGSEQLNEKPLKNPKEVNEFLESLDDDDEDEEGDE